MVVKSCEAAGTVGDEKMSVVDNIHDFPITDALPPETKSAVDEVDPAALAATTRFPPDVASAPRRVWGWGSGFAWLGPGRDPMILSDLTLPTRTVGREIGTAIAETPGTSEETGMRHSKAPSN